MKPLIDNKEIYREKIDRDFLEKAGIKSKICQLGKVGNTMRIKELSLDKPKSFPVKSFRYSFVVEKKFVEDFTLTPLYEAGREVVCKLLRSFLKDIEFVFLRQGWWSVDKNRSKKGDYYEGYLMLHCGIYKGGVR